MDAGAFAPLADDQPGKTLLLFEQPLHVQKVCGIRLSLGQHALDLLTGDEGAGAADQLRNVKGFIAERARGVEHGPA